jgi:hypothetical protein
VREVTQRAVRSPPGPPHPSAHRLPPPLPPPPGLGAVLPKLPGAPVEPAVRAGQVEDLMATSLVKDLADRGVSARRLEKHRRFALSGRDLDRNVGRTATQVAEQVARRLTASSSASR